MISLQSLQKTKHAAPPRILLHGGEKVGKSTFFSQAPNPVFIQTEDGLSGIDTTAFPLAKTWEDVEQALNSLLNEQHDFKTVITDSADWLERLIHDKVCRDYGVEIIDKAAGGYGKGYQAALIYFRRFLELMNRLNKEKGMIIGVICHSKIETINDPETEPYDCWKMKLHSPKSGQGAMDLLNEWADVIGFANKKTLAVKRETTDKYKGKTTQERQLHLEGQPAFMAGNRYSLPALLPLAWADFETALAATFQPVEQAQTATNTTSTTQATEQTAA